MSAAAYWQRLGCTALLAGAILLTLAACAVNRPTSPSPLIDVHLHFNWDQAELIEPEQAVQRLRDAGVLMGVVSSVPSHYAARLHAAAPDRIIALFSPYLEPGRRWLWHRQPGVVEATRTALESGIYRGIGELHLEPGAGPRLDDPVLTALLKLAVEFDVPALVHTDTSDHRYLLTLCRAHPRARILWAHAGGKLAVDEIGLLLDRCPNVSADLSARDPWRYDSLADVVGELPHGWRELILRHPGRFMIGSDPVWSVRKTQRWDSADEGWDYLAMLLEYHRHWLAHFPKHIQHRLLVENAQTFFRIAPLP